jgi:hypothetical protein
MALPLRMREGLYDVAHLAWRLGRNVLCAHPVSRRWLYPSQRLAASFGPADVEYAWSVFQRHGRALDRHGFVCAERILEVGPGRNFGSAMLWWATTAARPGATAPSIVLWDVYPNCDASGPDVWRGWASGLLAHEPCHRALAPRAVALLDGVARGLAIPSIRYEVCTLDRLRDRHGQSTFDLVYSQAALEHVWNMRDAWQALVAMTTLYGWHSHRIDLADHGRRDTNYVEMLQWSRPVYWLTMRFVPGAVNRWRAGEHLAAMEAAGLRVLAAVREARDALPVPRTRLAAPFRAMADAELRTTAVDIVARRER